MERLAPVSYTVKTRPRGGAGRAARWQWEVYKGDSVGYVVSGEVTGAESKARQAGEEARQRLIERDLADARKKDKE